MALVKSLLQDRHHCRPVAVAFFAILRSEDEATNLSQGARGLNLKPCRIARLIRGGKCQFVRLRTLLSARNPNVKSIGQRRILTVAEAQPHNATAPGVQGPSKMRPGGSRSRWPI